MFGLHMPELIIILVVALLIFGPKKLPEMGSSIGKSIKEFRKGMNELSQPKEEKDDEIKVPNAEAQKQEFLASQSASNEQLSNLQSNKVESEVSHSEVTSPEMSRE
jgi:sec-independent protein translocase protein TatA